MAELFQSIGLSESKAKDTERNVAVSDALKTLILQVSSFARASHKICDANIDECGVISFSRVACEVMIRTGLTSQAKFEIITRRFYSAKSSCRLQRTRGRWNTLSRYGQLQCYPVVQPGYTTGQSRCATSHWSRNRIPRSTTGQPNAQPCGKCHQVAQRDCPVA